MSPLQSSVGIDAVNYNMYSTASAKTTITKFIFWFLAASWVKKTLQQEDAIFPQTAANFRQ